MTSSLKDAVESITQLCADFKSGKTTMTIALELGCSLEIKKYDLIIGQLQTLLTHAARQAEMVEVTYVDVNNIVAEAMLRFDNSVDATKFILEMLKERRGVWFLKDESKQLSALEKIIGEL